jgi:tetratricopeptide (TPR) repeat protein
MDEERIKAYLALIDQLISCPSGDEIGLLNDHIDLLDLGLIRTMELVAEKMREQENPDAAQFLQELATQLMTLMENAEQTPLDPEDYFKFLSEVLQVVAETPDPQVVYPMLQQNTDKLDEFLAELLRGWAATVFNETPTEDNQVLAGVLGNFSQLIQQFPLGNPHHNLEIAIAGYEIAASILDRDTLPEVWAGTQNNLAVAYGDRLGGERVNNLDQAITCYENALQVYTLDKFPEQWKIIQQNLALTQEERQAIEVNS